MPNKKFILEYRRAPGDVLMMTALVRDLKLTYGDGIILDVRAPYPDIWQNNPYLDKLDAKESGVTTINFDRGAQAADRIGLNRSQKGDPLHYCSAFHVAWTEKTKIPVDVLFSKPDIHLSQEELAEPPITGSYVILAPGYKTDITAKAWLFSRWQEVADRLIALGIKIVQDGTIKPSHINPTLIGAINTVGKHSIRGLMKLIYHSDCLVGGCSLPMHLAGALEKPAVILMGGRESPSYEHYTGKFGPKAEPVKVPHVMLDTIGELDCCRNRGCWLRRVVQLPDRRDAFNKSLCKHPDTQTDRSQPVAKCMSMITTDQVIDSVLKVIQVETPSNKIDASPAMPTTYEMETFPTHKFNGSMDLRQKKETVLEPKATSRLAASTYENEILCPFSLIVYSTNGPRTKRCISSLSRTDGINRLPVRVIPDSGDKIPQMREELRKSSTPWILWADDSHVFRSKSWLTDLEGLVSEVSDDVGAIGVKVCHVLKSNEYRNAKWFKGVDLQIRTGATAPNGNCVIYLDTTFMALRSKAIIDCDIPDESARNAIVIGAQLHQGGFKIKSLPPTLALYGQKNFL